LNASAMNAARRRNSRSMFPSHSRGMMTFSSNQNQSIDERIPIPI
jgi:hypothetical protein